LACGSVSGAPLAGTPPPVAGADAEAGAELPGVLPAGDALPAGDTGAGGDAAALAPDAWAPCVPGAGRAAGAVC
jgi:hypothetical protein